MATIFTKNGSVNVNPFYQQVDKFVKDEMHNRAALYSRRVRSVGPSPPRSVEWGYQKTAYAIVSGGGITMGTAGSNVMSDKDGKLTLYSSSRNVPSKPLLQKVEIANEGQLGSFLKATITFTVFPELGKSGFDIEGIEDAFFIPGRDVKLTWGWSSYAQNQKACTGGFTGIVYNFNWNFNSDLSITATVQIISPSGLSVAMSADLTNTADNAKITTDAAGNIFVGSNLSKVIDADLAQASGSVTLADGGATYIASKDTANQKLDYFVLGLPIQQPDPNADANKNIKVSKTHWYVKLGSIVAFLNELLKAYDDPMKTIFDVQCFGNQTQYLKDCFSAYPLEVYFPDEQMGAYGDLIPFGSANNVLTYGMPSGRINIGEILLSTDFVKKTYESFIAENAANIPYKSLPKLLEELVKRINHASGDMYDFTPVLFEPELNNIGGQVKSILSIEDTNLSTDLGNSVTPFEFSPTIFKPIVRNVNISSNTPALMMQAAFAAARGKAKPAQSNVRIATESQRDNAEYDKEYWHAIDNLLRLRFQAMQSGFSDSWSEECRGFLVKVKRTSNAQDAHWLHKAIFPIKFDVTIDGINGFKFGDTLSTTMIPEKYNSVYNMVFTVTKIVHTIENKDWSTTLETAARVTSLGKGPDPSMRTAIAAPPGIGILAPSSGVTATTTINPGNQSGAGNQQVSSPVKLPFTVTPSQKTSGASTTPLILKPGYGGENFESTR